MSSTFYEELIYFAELIGRTGGNNLCSVFPVAVLEVWGVRFPSIWCIESMAFLLASVRVSPAAAPVTKATDPEVGGLPVTGY